MKIYGVVPARLASSRLPRKLLLSETGRPLVQYAWEAAMKSRRLDEVLIATDSPEIAAVAERFGAKCVLTGEHPSGTDRIAEVAATVASSGTLFVNIQGDEPELAPSNIDLVVDTLLAEPTADMSTLATPIRRLNSLQSMSCVKVVRGTLGNALYFSRAAIPFVRDESAVDLLGPDGPFLHHLGIYAYRREFLLRLTKIPPSPLEQLEKLEQLRALELGGRIQVGVVAEASVGIDTPDDYAAFRLRELERQGEPRSSV